MEKSEALKFIKKSRKTLKLTQTELGEKIGVDIKTIQSWEYEIREPNKSAIILVNLLLKGVKW